MKKRVNKVVSLSLSVLFSSSCISASEVGVLQSSNSRVKDALLAPGFKNVKSTGYIVPRNVAIKGSVDNSKSSSNTTKAVTSVCAAVAATLVIVGHANGLFKGKIENPTEQGEIPWTADDVAAPVQIVNENLDYVNPINDTTYSAPSLSDYLKENKFASSIYTPVLRPKVIKYLNYLENCYWIDRAGCCRYVLGKRFLDGEDKVRLMANESDMDRKCFLCDEHCTSGTRLDSCWVYATEDGPDTIPCVEYIEQNKYNNAGWKYDILMRLIGLDINGEDDIGLLAEALRRAGFVNEKECITIGITDFEGKQNKICIAMYGYKNNEETFKKMIVSDAKGLNLYFMRSLVYGTDRTASAGGWTGSTQRYYYITPTSIEKI